MIVSLRRSTEQLRKRNALVRALFATPFAHATAGSERRSGNAVATHTNHVATNRDERVGEFMTKQIEIHGQRVQLYSLDGGCTWSSSPQAIVAYRQREKMLRLELQQRFERIDGKQDPDTNNIGEFAIPRSRIGR